jgi:arginase
LGNISAKDYK